MGGGKSRRSQGARSNSASNGGAEATTFWRSSLVAGVNFFKASFTASHVFSRHTHDEYSIAVIERGAPTVTCRGAAHLASPGSFLLINPDEPHEGRSAGGRAYRMMYVEASALGRLLDLGLPPHGYLTQVRLREARRRLLAGRSPALVAAEVGFVDQSHLIKRFRSAFGMTPGQYVSANSS
jgi:quercetin dioxygenase-like cupin family protein